MGTINKQTVIAHRGNWAGVKEDQNSLEAIIKADKAGYAVELDLRVGGANNEIYCSHDPVTACETRGPKLHNVLKIYKKNNWKLPVIFFHIKKDPFLMLERLLNLTKDLETEFYIFGLDEQAKKEYARLFGWEKIIYELETGVTGSVNEAISSKSNIIWFGVNKKELLVHEQIKLLESDKKVYYCSPELFGRRPVWEDGHIDFIFDGVCTDLPFYYKCRYELT